MAPRPNLPESGLSAAPWWTSADQAELDVLVWSLLEMFEAHRACAGCGGRGACQPVRDAWDAFESWLAARRLLSRAEWLRRRQVLARLAELREAA